jgi:hypothetical protein
MEDRQLSFTLEDVRFETISVVDSLLSIGACGCKQAQK